MPSFESHQNMLLLSDTGEVAMAFVGDGAEAAARRVADILKGSLTMSEYSDGLTADILDTLPGVRICLSMSALSNRLTPYLSASYRCLGA